MKNMGVAGDDSARDSLKGTCLFSRYFSPSFSQMKILNRSSNRKLNFNKWSEKPTYETKKQLEVKGDSNENQNLKKHNISIFSKLQFLKCDGFLKGELISDRKKKTIFRSTFLIFLFILDISFPNTIMIAQKILAPTVTLRYWERW